MDFVGRKSNGRKGIQGMCGIAGIIRSQSSSKEALYNPVKRMQEKLLHRGPDDLGVYVSPSACAALAHTRLSILDLSLAGHQPMSTEDGRYHITFNGEIYNFRELRERLLARGETFFSNSDTEVILKLYKHYGTDFLGQLRGMFAFAIWDERERTCFLARDPFGIKTVYYYHSSDTFVFASELKALLASELVPRKIDLQAVSGYLMTGSVQGPNSLVKDVQSLDPGHSLVWKDGRIAKNRYWQIRFPERKMKRAEAVDITRHALRESVNYHFVSDVPVGIFLSGGLDSTALLALASLDKTRELRTYSIACEDNVWNEGGAAQRTAEHFGARHRELFLDSRRARMMFTDYLDILDQPTVDGFNTYCVSKLAHESGAKVVLSGLGADEIFAGYPSFRVGADVMRYKAASNFLWPLRQGLGLLMKKNRAAKAQRLAEFFMHKTEIPSFYKLFRGVFSVFEAGEILKGMFPDQQGLSDAVRHSQELFFDQCRVDPAMSVPDQISHLELSRYMRNQLLRDSDVMSMRFGLELRLPFVDSKLFDAVSVIPVGMRLEFCKEILKSAVPEVPSWVLERKKQGFLFPIPTWFDDKEWRDMAGSESLPKGVDLAPWSRRHAVIALDHWLAREGFSINREKGQSAVFKLGVSTPRGVHENVSAKATLFLRNSPSGYSIENIAKNIFSHAPKGVELRIFKSSYLSRGLFDRIRAAWEVRGQQGDINHITGDVHFLTYFLRKKRTILTIHDCERLMSCDYSFWKKVIYRFFWYTLPQWRCACITAVSEETKKNLVRYAGISPKKIRVIHDGIDDQFRVLDLGLEEKKRFLQNEQGKKTVMHIGVKQANKNMTRLIEALVGMDVKLIKVGKMENSDKELLEKHKIDFLHLESVDGEFLVKVYNSVDCLAVPSLIEGFGMPVVEAQRCGCPVVTSNVSSLPEVAGSGAVLVDPYSVESIRNGIRRVLEDEALRKDLIREGFENARRFDWSVIAKQYYELYQEIMEEAGV
jgi:asparagine synthase (glutamine-hydrolysing)